MSYKCKVVDFKKVARERRKLQTSILPDPVHSKVFPGFKNLRPGQASCVKILAKGYKQVKEKKEDPWSWLTSNPPKPKRSFTKDELQKGWEDYRTLILMIRRKLRRKTGKTM